MELRSLKIHVLLERSRYIKFTKLTMHSETFYCYSVLNTLQRTNKMLTTLINITSLQQP